jgi:hypothetical protein
MGIEYRHYLMPVSRPFRPSPKQVVELISIFRAARWIATPDAASFKKVKFETTAENEHAGESGAFAKTKKGIRPLEPNPAPDLLADLMEDDAILEWPVEHIGRADLEYPF